MKDTGQRVSVVRRKLRVNRIAGGKHLPGSREIGHIAVFLASEHRETGKSLFLCMLDLRIPVGAFHEAHGYAMAGFPGYGHKVRENLRCPALIGLYGDPEAVVTAQRTVAKDGIEYLQ